MKISKAGYGIVSVLSAVGLMILIFFGYQAMKKDNK